MKAALRMAEIGSIFAASINKATVAFIMAAFIFVGSVNAATLTVTNSADSGAGTLRDIVGASLDGDVIEFDPGVTYITLTTGYIRINNNIHVKGPGPASLTIDGSSNSCVFYISQAGTTATVSGVTITNCYTTTKGGGIYQGTSDTIFLTISNCVITACSADSYGGGIAVLGGKSVIVDTVITGCTSGTHGGGLYNDADVDLDMKGCTIGGNTATRSGGGIYTKKKLLMENCTVSGNTALGTTSTDAGGGIRYYLTGAVTNMLINCIISNNVATVKPGGGIGSYKAFLDISNCVVTANSSAVSGGGIYCYDTLSSETHIWNSTISSNSAPNYGGGLYIVGQRVWIYNSTFLDNSTTNATYGRGGAIYNTAYNSYKSFLFVDSSLFYNNHATGYGGALCFYDPAELRNCTLSGNVADYYGGAIYLRATTGSETQKFYNCTIYDNTGSDGGGIYLYGGTPEIYSCIIASNMPNSDIRGNIPILNNSLYNYMSGTPGSATNNITGDPQLEPLADNGGPTLTHALIKGSIAVDAGSNPLSLDYDQRGVGYPREVGVGQPDIGAYEFNAGAPQGTIVIIN